MHLDPSLSVGERAKLYALSGRQWAVVALAVGVVVACASCTKPRVTAVYDPDTHLVSRLDYDDEMSGRIVARTYFSNGRPVRLEVDPDGNGSIDRWEYYGADGVLVRLGRSSKNDGREDTWVTQSGYSMRVDISTRRDGFVDRREYHEQGALIRAEQDTNFDRLVDEWQEFDDGKLHVLLIDTEQRRGRPDRRLVYGLDGSLTGFETDPDGDGHFTPQRIHDASH
jgi:hypothetical protein